jgi:circadian clock protein KaiC
MKKTPTGIEGLDAVLLGGLPTGRTTVVIGGPGSGKTVLAMQFLVNGSIRYDEPGLMVSFEESPAALEENFRTMAGPGASLPNARLHFIDGRMPGDAIEAGTFDLGGLIAIATSLIVKHGITRVAIDGLDALFALSERRTDRRREILRLITWLADTSATTLMTLKRLEAGAQDGYYELAEYAADGVLAMKTTKFGELTRRTISVDKMRGTGFEGGSHAYTISDQGIRVLHYPTRTAVWASDSRLRLSTGIERLDTMLTGGYRVGTTTLISGLPGTSKTTMSAAFLHAGALAGERGLFVGFDEPAQQMLCDMESVGLGLDEAVGSGLLRAESYSAGAMIGDEHFLAIEMLIDEHRPTRVVIDPVSALEKAGGRDVADAIMERLVVLFKSRGITSIITAVADPKLGELENTPTRISTIADAWIHLSYANRGGERNRTLTIVKARGTDHSNQMREVILSPTGFDLADVFSSGGQVLVGTARAQREQQELVDRALRDESSARELERLDREAQTLNRQLQEAQRGLAQLFEHREQVVRRTATSGRAQDRETNLTHALRHGDLSS